MTLAALILFLISGFFFGVRVVSSIAHTTPDLTSSPLASQCGTCITRKNRREQQQSDAYRPMPDEAYGSKLRAEAVQADYARKAASDDAHLPNFPEHVPLTATHAVDYDDSGYHQGQNAYPPLQQQHQQYASHGNLSAVSAGHAPGAPPSLISGVGEGYGRRNPSAPGQAVSFSPESAAAPLPPVSPVGGGTGVGARLASEARANRGLATREDEWRLAGGGAGAGDAYDAPQQQGYGYGDVPQQGSSQGHAMSPSSYHGGAYPPYPAVASSPPPQQQGSMPYVQGYHSATPVPGPPVLPYRPSKSPPAQQHQQTMFVQNADPGSYGDPYDGHAAAGAGAGAGETGSLAPTYYTHDHGAGGGGGGGGGGSGMQYQRGGAAGQDPYGAPAGYGRY